MNTNETQISRRTFLTRSLILAPASNLLNNALFSKGREKYLPDKFSGLIASEIRFGSKLSSEIIRKNLLRLLRRFPDIDILMITGNNYPDNEAKILPGELLGTIPENTFAKPYYSLTIKGIHLVLLPRMVDATYISEEALQWLELDLKVHRNLTTIIVSHDSLKDSTESYEDRDFHSVANSEQALSLFRENPQVVAWCHGHSNTWELVKIWDRTFKSGGNFGKNFPKSQPIEQKLQAIYFEFFNDRFSFRGWSCDNEKFLDEICGDEPNLKCKYEILTSFNPDEPPSVSYGAGMSVDGEKISTYRCYVGSHSKASLYFMGIDDSFFNEKKVITEYGWNSSNNNIIPIIGGTTLATKEKEQRWAPNREILSIPFSEHVGTISPKREVAKYSLYPTASGNKYLACLKALAYSAGAVTTITWRIHKADGTILLEERDDEIPLHEGYNEVVSKFKVPVLDTASTNRDASSGVHLFLSIDCSFSNTGEGVRIELLQIELDNSERYTKNPAIEVDGKLYGMNGILRGKETTSMDIEIPRDKDYFVVTTKVEGSELLTYLVEEKGIQYQARNSSSYQKEAKTYFSTSKIAFSDNLPGKTLTTLLRFENT
ncbi:MAG: hypothetical protein N3G21_13045 [Candidatus Hydrogenedentes bacterium]|nr:hypothetical protein [Candidatus Hydrogenedentota bacterium]